LDLTDFPTEVVTDDDYLYRAHDARFTDPWFFANDTNGRFNLDGDRGTCYAAEGVETAVRERFGVTIVESQEVERDFAEGMAVSVILITAGTEVAAVNHDAAVTFGLTREIGTTTDYTVTRSWATRFDSEHLDGIHYASRFTTGADANSFALFGPAGTAPSYPHAPQHRIDGVNACSRAHLRIVPSDLDDETAEVIEPPRP
jgi:hypothetical protein